MKTRRALRLFLVASLLVAAGTAGAAPATLSKERRDEFRARYGEASRLFHSAHDPEAAMKLLVELEKDTAATPGGQEWRRSALWKIAQVHGHAGRVERAVELYEEIRSELFAGSGRLWTANHFLVLSNLCGNYERLGKMGMVAIRHAEAVEQARAYFTHWAGVPPQADPFSHDDATLDRLNNIGFLGQVYDREARLRFQAGREEAAIELALRLERRVREPFKNHWERDLQARARMRLVEWFDELGRTEERDEWEERLLVPEGTPGAGRFTWHLVRMRRAARLHAQGVDREAQMVIARATLEWLFATNHPVDALDGQAILARMLADEGRGAEGLAALDLAIEELASLQVPLVLAKLLLARAELRLELGQGLDEATERDIHAALAWFRGVGGRREELGAYRIYARFLRLSGRIAEAKAVLSEGAGRLRAFTAPEQRRRFAEEWGAIAEVERAKARPAGAGGAVRQTPTGAGDLQPLEIVSRARAGEATTARFAITNPTETTMEGTARVSGPVESAQWDEASLVWRVTLAEGAPRSEARREVGLGALEQARLVLSRREPTEAEPVEVSWTVAGETQTAWWRVEPAVATGARAVARNDNLALGNAFYSVPLHHPLRAREGVSRGARMDLRVSASAPCRIELVRASDGRVLAVDAQGDGSFRGAGDLLWEDWNRDGYPDVAADVDDESGLELHVFPQDRAVAVTVRLEGRVGGGDWEVQTTDRLLGDE